MPRATATGMQPESPVCRCHTCGNEFQTPAGFDKHLKRSKGNATPPQCRPPASVGMHKNHRGRWTTGAFVDARQVRGGKA